MASAARLCTVHSWFFLSPRCDLCVMWHTSRIAQQKTRFSFSVSLCEHADVSEICRADLLSAECRRVLHAGLCRSFSARLRLERLGHKPTVQHAADHVNIGDAQIHQLLWTWLIGRLVILSSATASSRYSLVVHTVVSSGHLYNFDVTTNLPILSFTFFFPSRYLCETVAMWLNESGKLKHTGQH